MHTKSLLFAALAFCGLMAAGHADAQTINCQVYASQPASTFFAVGATPVLPCDRTGAPWVNAPTAAGGTSSNFGAAFPAAGTAAGFTDGTNMQAAKVDGNKYVDIDIQTFTASLPSGTNVIGHVIADTGSTTAVTALPALPAGSNVIGHVIADTGSTTTVTALPAIPAGTNLIGSVNVAAAATGGCTPAHLLSGASTNATVIKASAGTLCKLSAINTTATLYYLKFYNVTTGPTCNSDTVVATYPVPASTTGAGVEVNLGPFGEAYTTGIAFCLTAGLADNDNTNAATGIAISYSSK